jgi:(2R)-3-sulfolactate dehydrogenase (NADP+)
MPLVSLDDIERTVQAALMQHGAGAFAAAEVARAVARAEATGNRICGLYYLESYCAQLKTGRVQGDVVPVVTALRPAAIYVDALLGFAQPAFAYGLAPALDAARQYGVATLAVGHAHTCTSLGYFTEQIAQAGLIGIGMTNASPIVAPPGGRTRMIGTNPIAFRSIDHDGRLGQNHDGQGRGRNHPRRLGTGRRWQPDHRPHSSVGRVAGIHGRIQGLGLWTDGGIAGGGHDRRRAEPRCQTAQGPRGTTP